jgi:hypothetical protein
LYCHGAVDFAAYVKLTTTKIYITHCSPEPPVKVFFVLPINSQFTLSYSSSEQAFPSFSASSFSPNHYPEPDPRLALLPPSQYQATTQKPKWPSRSLKNSSTSAAPSAVRLWTSAPTTTAPAVSTAPLALTSERATSDDAPAAFPRKRRHGVSPMAS